MIIGNPSIFAIESEFAKAYERLSLRALGFFVIHIRARSYGLHKPDASMLACSFDAVKQRIASRGKHTAPFAAETDPGKVADAFRKALFADNPGGDFFGLSLAKFRSFFDKAANDLMWAPDGDQAFDDGSYVLQLDVHERARLIAFKSAKDYRHDPSTLSDLWLPADDFYEILQRWVLDFEQEWASTPKSSEGD